MEQSGRPQPLIQAPIMHHRLFSQDCFAKPFLICPIMPQTGTVR